MYIVLGVLALTFLLIAAEKLRAELASIGACCLLLVTGVLSPAEAFPLFANEAIVTVGAMFVLSAALERTGAIEAVSRALQVLPLRNETLVLCVVLPLALAISAFANNTPVVAVFMPIMMAIARERGLAASKLLIPLSFTSILGGSCTLIGTSTNLVASAVGSRLGLAPIGLFELAPVGLLLAAIGLAYLLLCAPRLLPVRETVTAKLARGAKRQYLTEAFVPAGSSLIGLQAKEALARSLPRAHLVEVIRHDKNADHQPERVRLEPGDRLRVHVDADGVAAIKTRRGLDLHASQTVDLALGDTEETRLFEWVVGPHSTYAGRTIAETDIRRRFGVAVHALHRAGENMRDHFDTIPLHTGDVLLIESGPGEFAALNTDGELLPLAGGRQPLRWSKRWLTGGMMVAVVALAALRILPVSVAALIAAVLVVAFGCLKAEEAYRAIDWSVLFLIGGMLVIGAALEQTHTVDVAARFVTSHATALGPRMMLSLMILAGSVLTNFLSNNAVAALLVPLAVETARQLHVDPRPFLMGVTFGASACFATPIGYQTNTLVFSAGGYRFGDFIRLGLPLNVLHWAVASLLIPIFWPLG
ncbi:MAG TPA: SLC13 family permease [Lacunisphaera sp.]|jgi:di/tricarboxylate transporter|nr:SLC13 family permease [Lacunisphaera sp.]